MRTITTIFALFLTALSGAKSIGCQRDEVLIFPQAAPVQFWLTGCDTYNETIPRGVHYKCFCQPWKCTDTIPIPFRDTFDESDRIEIETVVPITLPDMDEWLSLTSSDFAWTTGVNPSVTLNGDAPILGATSEYLYAPFAFEDGVDYTIVIDYDVLRSSSPANNPQVGRVVIMDSSFNILFSASESSSTALGIPVSNDVTINFTATSACVYIGFRYSSKSDVVVDVDGATGSKVEISYEYPPAKSYQLVIYGENDNEIDRLDFDAMLFITGLFYYYTVNVDIAELELCEEQIRFEVEDLTASPDAVVARSDCQKITDSEVDPTVLIEYSSPKNFNGLVFEGVSPDPTYNIRIPAVFFHEDILQVDEVAKLTSKVIKLNSQTELKRLLETDFMPYYMHIKIALILSMPLVQIEGLYWTKQDPYEKDDGSKRWPFRRYTCLLTQRDFLERQSI